MGIFGDDGGVTSYWEQQANTLRGELVALAAHVERLKRERDALVDTLRASELAHQETVQERDALAAHVRSLVKWADSYVGTTGLYEEVEAARKADTASITRLKAEWQGEVLDELGAWIIQRDECIDELDIEEFRLERSETEEE